jgi:hypothetical protein
MPDIPHPHPADFGNETIQPVLIALVHLMESRITSLGARRTTVATPGKRYNTVFFSRSPGD